MKKAYDIVPRDMAMATLRWMDVPEVEARMVEGTYEETKGRVVCGPGISEEFRECPKPTVIHCSSGDDQQESEYKGCSPQAAIRR